MRKAEKKSSIVDIPQTQLSANSLQGKQSVRTTFSLPEQMIDLLSVAAGQLGVKQKSLFDHLVEDREVLQQVAEEAQSYQPAGEERRSKTFVMSRTALLSLEKVAKKSHMPRDILVEVSIRRLLPVMDNEQEKQEKRQAILKDCKAYLGQGEKLLKKSARLLGKEDQIYKRLEDLVNLCDKSVTELSEVVEKGKRMEGLF